MSGSGARGMDAQGGSTGPQADTPARWRSVPGDMQAIFGEERATPSTARRTRPVADRPLIDTRRTRKRRLLLPLVLLTGAAGAAAGLVVVAPLQQPRETRPIVRPAALRTEASTPAVAMTAVAVPQPAIAPETTLVPRSTGEGAPFRVQPFERAQTASLAPPIARAVRSASPDDRTGCDDEDGDACSRADVIAADRDLRSAYRRAVDAGVDRGRLVAIRNRWARLRATEYDRPGELLADYAEMADRLDRAASDADDLR